MWNHMDENHQDKTESKLIATEDVRRGVNRKSKLWVPKHKKRTGFENKTLWDWLQLLSVLAIPLILGIATLLFGIQQAHLADLQHQSDQKLAQQQHEVDQQLAADQQEQMTLQTYLDDMTKLIFDDKLGSQAIADKAASAEAAVVAQAKTLIVLRRLNTQRKATVVQFLYEAHLIGYYDSLQHDRIIDLSSVNLSSVNLSGADLSEADLHDADLSYAILHDADLRYADLRGASLVEADLNFANLVSANLYGAVFTIDYPTYDLTASLYGANLSYANLSEADLHDADLHDADLRGANLSSANLRGADLSGADLSGARVQQDQLSVAKSLTGATMPDGTIHP
jgi:uncharacterized protein YjbI with pentapeptide repeats